MLNTRIITFLKLCEVMNYRKTAELLNMTQPAVTQHIKWLENNYECKLFEYNYKNLRKTDDAYILERYARSMMKNELELRKSLKNTKMDTIYLGATKTIGDYVIIDEIKEYLSDDNRSLSLVIDNTANLLDMLKKNTIDFAIIEGNFDKTYYDYKFYKKEKFVGICAKNHEFANKNFDFKNKSKFEKIDSKEDKISQEKFTSINKVKLGDIFSEDIIIREFGSGTRNILEHLLAQHSYSLENFKKIISISSFQVIKELVKSNFGISFVYESIAESDSELAVFELEDIPMYGEFNIVNMKNMVEDKSVKFLK